MTIHVATLTGLVDLLDPDPRRITPAAIAFGLAKLNRWAGDTELPISTAQHSMLVGHIFRRCFGNLSGQGIYADLHDAHEYLIGDIITPAAKLFDLRTPGLLGIIDREKSRLDVRILEALDLPQPTPTAEVFEAIGVADRLAYHAEWTSLMPASNGPSPYRELADRYRYRATRVVPLPWPEAERQFRSQLVGEIERLKAAA